MNDLAGFWRAIWDYFGVEASGSASPVVEGRMPDAHWFPGATLNYAEHALKRRDAHPALIFRGEDGERVELSYSELADLVGRVRKGLVELGVGRGDRVAALLPNRHETVAAFLAVASLGAIWSSCSPEFGAPSVLDRFQQIEPKVLLAVSGYRYGGKWFDRGAELERIVAGLPSVEHTVVLGQASLRSRARARALPSFRPGPASSRSSACPSSTRSGCSTPRAPRACRSPSCTGTEASCSSS